MFVSQALCAHVVWAWNAFPYLLTIASVHFVYLNPSTPKDLNSYLIVPYCQQYIDLISPCILMFLALIKVPAICLSIWLVFF